MAPLEVLQHRPRIPGRQIGLRPHVHHDSVPLVRSELGPGTRIMALRAIDRPQLGAVAKQPPLLGLADLLCPTRLAWRYHSQKNQEQKNYNPLHDSRARSESDCQLA